MSTKIQRLLRRLWPVGEVWQVDDTIVQKEVIDGLSDELTRFDDMITSLRTETIPFQSSYLLEYWVELFGLPNKCLDYTEDPAQLRIQLKEAIPRGRSHSPQAFIDLAATFGITITITVPLPSIVGQIQAGMPIGPAQSRYLWIVDTNLVQGPLTECGVAQAGDPISQWGTERPIECLFNKLQHSHRLIIFNHNG